jgi:GNAT superfamily N-acetyltransferase
LSRLVLIREARVDDAREIGELLAELGYPIDAAEATRRLARESETVYVAYDRERVLGLLSIWSQLPIARARPVARITAMVVRAESRGRGIGKALLDRAVQWATDEGCDGIELTSGARDERERAHRFYERFGFHKTSYRFWLPITEVRVER